jgi:hypothetical protein
MYSAPGIKRSWERISVWRASLYIIRHHPEGVGLGMYKYYFQRYQHPFKGIKYGRYGKETSQAHNEFLNFAAECSPLASIFALGFLAIIFRQVFRAMKGSRNDFSQMMRLVGFSGSLLGILSHSLVDFNLHQPPIMIVAVIDLAALIGVKFESFLDAPPTRTEILVDISLSWAQRYIVKVASLEIMNVYDNHTFQPRRIINRAELAETIKPTA